MTWTTYHKNFNYNALSKGDVISAAKVEKVVGVKRKFAAYSIRAMKFISEIEHKLEARAAPLFVTCKQDNNSIRILTDIEASEYNNHRVTIVAHRALRKAHQKLQHIDPSEMSTSERDEYMKNLLRAGNRLLGIKEADAATFKGQTYKPNLPPRTLRRRQILPQVATPPSS